MFDSKLKSGLLVAVALGCSSGAALASVVVHESFTYANGALAGNNGGVGFGGTWTGGGSVAGGVATMSTNVLGTRNLASAIVPTAGQSFYVGFNLSADPSAATSDFAGLAFLSAGADRLFLGMPFQRNVYGIGVNGYATVSSTVAASAVPSYLVAQVAFNTLSNITINLYVDPVGPLGVADATYTGAFLAAGNWDQLRIVNSNSSSTFDNIVIGTTLADVYSPAASVPVPATLALAGLGLALMSVGGARRRRAS